MGSKNETIEWSPEARERLSRVPVFLRRMVRGRAEALAVERGAPRVTGEHLTELAKNRPGGSAEGTAPDTASEGGRDEARMAWTAAARERLEETPSFFQAEFQRIAEEAARAGGHLEVNLALLDGLEDQEPFRRRLVWSDGAEAALEEALARRPGIVADFVRPGMEEAAERIVRAERRSEVDAEDVKRAFDTASAGVEWNPEALARVENAPEFVRAGIKKAAEAGARREGKQRIEPEDLTRFRNRAMMRAVKRMRGFGFRELSFDVFETAQEQVPRLRGNTQAERRFASIREHVEGKGGLGVIDGELLERMRRMLSEAPEDES